MFKRPRLFHRDRIESDEGFSVSFGRDTLIYRESEKTMSVTVDIGANEANVFRDSIGRWDHDPSDAVSDQEKQRIAEI